MTTFKECGFLRLIKELLHDWEENIQKAAI